MSKIIEDQKPNWPPGEMGGYHVFTFGWLVDQLVRRVDPKGRSVGEFFREEIADKFDLDFWIGFPAEFIQRVARIRAPTFDQTLRSLTDPGFALFYFRHLYGYLTGAISVEIRKKAKQNNFFSALKKSVAKLHFGAAAIHILQGSGILLTCARFA